MPVCIHLDEPVIPIKSTEFSEKEASRIIAATLNMSTTPEYNIEWDKNMVVMAYMMSILDGVMSEDVISMLDEKSKPRLITEFVDQCVHIGFLMGVRSEERKNEKLRT